jgi:hypothetical protein
MCLTPPNTSYPISLLTGAEDDTRCFQVKPTNTPLSTIEQVVNELNPAKLKFVMRSLTIA